MADKSLIPFEIKLDGKLITADSPVTIGKNFSKFLNLRYGRKRPKGVGGMTKINSSNPLDSGHQHVQNAFHFVKNSPVESHVLVQTVDTSDDNPAIVQNETAIPGTGDFTGGATPTELYAEDASAGVARFADAPRGQVAICDGKESLIWGGDESVIAAALVSTATITTALTNPRDYSVKVMNSSEDADQRLLLGGGNDAYTKVLLHMDGTDGSSTFTDSASGKAHAGWTATNAVLDTDYSKFGVSSGKFDGTGDKISAANHADFDLSGGIWTIDLQAKSDLSTIDHSLSYVLYYKETDGNNYNALTLNGVSVSTQDIAPEGLFFKPDGTKMYEVGYASNKIYQYTLSSAWDLSTATYDSVSISTQDTQPAGVFFKPDGLKMYEIGWNGDKVYQYTLSSAWDLSTATYDSVSISTQDSVPTGLFFKSDGLKMYEIGWNGDKVYQYTLSSAWDLSTATYDSVSISTQDTNPEGIFFKPDGLKMYEVGSNSDKVYQYTLSSAWDLSTATYDSVSISTQDSNPQGIFFKPDGLKMYEVGYASDKVYQYTLSSAWDLSTATPDLQVHYQIVASGTAVVDIYSAGHGLSWWKSDFRHIAAMENGNAYYLAVEGTINTISDANRPVAYTGGVTIGMGGTLADYNGKIDEFRLSKGIIRWPSDFSPQATAYSSEGLDFLVGSTRPLKGGKFYVPAGGENATSATLTMKEWNGNSWSSVTITDNTSGFTVAGGGTVTWASTVDTSKIRYFEGYLLYWYNFTLSAGNVDISQITIDAPIQKRLDSWDGVLRTIFSYQIFSGSNYNDYTVNVSKDSYDTGNSSTYVTAVSPATALNTLLTASEYQYVGSFERLTGLEIHIIGGQGNAATGTMELAYWNGSSWTDATNVIDGTLEGGITFAKSGVLTWQLPDEAVEFKKQIAGGIPLYFYRLHGSANFSAVDIQVYYIAGIPAQNRIGNWGFPLMADGCSWLCDEVEGKRNEILRALPGAPEGFNGSESFRIGFGDEKKLICATVLNTRKDDMVFDIKLIFKKNSMYGLTGSGARDSYRTFEISRSIGCVAPLTLDTTILENEGNIIPIAIWQGANGLYIYNDFKPIPIHIDIRNFFDKNESATRRMHTSYKHLSVGFVDEEKREYHWLFADGSSSGTLNREFVFDLTSFRLFEIDRGTGKYLQCAITTEDTDGNTYQYGFIDTGYMERLENGTDFDGSDIVHTLQTGHGSLHEDSSMYETTIRYFKLIMKTKSTTTNEVAVTHYGDGKSTGTSIDTFDPTKAGYEFTNKTKQVNLGKHTHHSIKMVMTTDDETIGFEPDKIGGFYKVEREDRR